MNLEIGLDQLKSLYHKFQPDLQKVRSEQSAFYCERGYLSQNSAPPLQKLISSSKRALGLLKGHALLKPQLDDVEAELTYLLLREIRPKTVVEISPCGGWSTTWILRAIKDNGVGHLYSFDLVDDSVKNIPSDLARNCRTFIQGKVQDNLDRLPQDIDYLFIDSDHSSIFGQWYIENIFPRLQSGTPISVHDVFHTSDPSGFDSEGGVVISWLAQSKIPYFTASPAKNPSGYGALIETKKLLGFDEAIHRVSRNSMIYFNR